MQTPHGKGVVIEARNGGRLLVQVQQRALVIAASDAVAISNRRRHATPAGVEAEPPSASSPARHHVPHEVDLHGLPVMDALALIDDSLDAALRAGHAELRVIHGRSGGRLRGALHARLRDVAAVRGFRLDPRNPGVTIVSL